MQSQLYFWIHIEDIYYYTLYLYPLVLQIINILNALKNNSYFLEKSNYVGLVYRKLLIF